MGSLVELADLMTGCLLGGTIIGQVIAVGVIVAVVLVALFIATRFLDSRLSAPVLIVGLVVGTGVAVYSVGSSFAVFESDHGELHPQATRHARCKQTPEPGNEVRLGTRRVAVLLP